MTAKHQIQEWLCHKRVRAGKITNIVKKDESQTTVLHLYGGDWVEVDAAYMAKHKPECGGYYVYYEGDGYESFSPAKPFETGYTKLPFMSMVTTFPPCADIAKPVDGVDIDAVHRNVPGGVFPANPFPTKESA